MCYETLKHVQGDKSGLFTRPSSASRARIRSPFSTPVLKIKVIGLRKMTAENIVVSDGFGDGVLHRRRRKV